MFSTYNPMLNLHLIAHLWDPGHSLNKQDVCIDSNLCYKEKLHYKKKKYSISGAFALYKTLF